MSEKNLALTEFEIQRRHAFYQKSFTGETPAPTRSTSPMIQGRVKSRASNQKTRRSIALPTRKVRAKSLDDTRLKASLNTPTEILDYRRKHRADRSRPWTEKLPKAPTQKYGVRIFYDKTLPNDVDESKVTLSSRKYVSNSKYGNIYRIQQDKPKKKEKTPPPQQWLWEDEYKLWLGGTREKYLNDTSSRLKQVKVSFAGTSGDMTSQSSRSSTLPSINGDKKGHRPTANVYAQYNHHRLETWKRRDAVKVLQRFFRGWYVRSFLKRLKKKALLQHGRLWPNFIQDYRDLVTKIQTRYGNMKPSCRTDLWEIKTFMDRKQAYEKAFILLAKAGKLPRDGLMEFFNRCDLWPTQADINRAFDAIFKGSRNNAEVVFVLDCSSNAGVVGFYNLIKFVKDLVINLDIAADRTRVGMVPFNEGVFNCFGITDHDNKQDILSAIGKNKIQHGLTRTDLALRFMRDMFKNSRPGVQKIGIVITGGQSENPETTRREARTSKEHGIELITISVGDESLDEMVAIASSPDHVYKALDAKSLTNIKRQIEKRFCLDPAHTDQSSQSHTEHPSRPLERSESLEVVFTCYPPEACGLEHIHFSRWIRPIVNNTEAWSFMDDDIVKKTGMKACLQLVIQARLNRHGYITVPSDVREGIEKVTNETQAMELVEKFINDRMTLTIDKNLKTVANLKIEEKA